jgi:hypothetical protein
VATSGNVFVGPFVDPNAGQTTESIAQVSVKSAGTVSDLKALVNTAPGNGNTWTVTVRKNGVNTAVTCTITNPNLTCTDTTHSVAFAAGDDIDVLIFGTSTPSAARLTWVATYN